MTADQEEPVTEITHWGKRFALGLSRQPSCYCVWDRRHPADPPVKTWPMTPEGWEAAWRGFTDWEPEPLDARMMPKCPTCGSQSVNRISHMDKFETYLTMGVFGIGHMAKTYRCNNCRYSW